MKKLNIKLLMAGAVIALLIAVLASSAFTVAENEYKCIFRFAKIERIVDQAGLHFKIPFIDSTQTYPKVKLFYDSKPSEVLTLDAKAMTADSFIVWRIEDMFKFFQSLGTVSNAQERLDAITYNVMQRTVGTILQDDIISTDEQSRRLLSEAIKQTVISDAQTYGIEVIDVMIKRFDLPPDNENAVFERMISERNSKAELYRAEGSREAAMIRNEVDKKVNTIISNAEADAERIISEGESEYMRLLAEAYNNEDKRSFYVFIRGLEALKASLSGENKTVILDANSELAQILAKPTE